MNLFFMSQQRRQKVRISSWNLSQDLQYRLLSQIWKTLHFLLYFTFFCGFSQSCQLLALRWYSSSNFMLMSSIESWSRSQNPARSCAVGRGLALMFYKESVRTRWPDKTLDLKPPAELICNTKVLKRKRWSKTESKVRSLCATGLEVHTEI